MPQPSVIAMNETSIVISVFDDALYTGGQPIITYRALRTSPATTEEVTTCKQIICQQRMSCMDASQI